MMFDLCVTIMSNDKINENNKSEKSLYMCEDIKPITGAAKLIEDIAAREESFEMENTVIQITNKQIDNSGETAKYIPNIVATPFPPLNPIQIGNMCPKTANNDIMAILRFSV